jgi:hypothetical protein
MPIFFGILHFFCNAEEVLRIGMSRDTQLSGTMASPRICDPTYLEARKRLQACAR